MHVRCPHCHNPIELVDDAEFSDIPCPSCGSSFSLLVEETISYDAAGQTIGHFELIEQLGVGAFGSVWKAKDTELDRTVAVKIPRKDQLNAEETEKFLREARAAAQLQHPNVVSVHEVGRQDGQVYIVSDYVQGATLSDWMDERKPTARESAELCVKIADALHHAHEAGVIHRDLKPSNIMMDLAGEPHIMDFGLAKREAGEVTMTMDGKVIGTPAYMSPEQARGEGHEADRRSDVYSLGVILFRLLTGELPFRGNARMLVVQILTDEPPSPRKLNVGISRDLETTCLKCLEKEPGQRYQTAKEFAGELRRFVRGEPIQARPISGLDRTWRWCKRRPAQAAFITTTTVLLLTLGIGGPWVAIQTRQYAVDIQEEQTQRALSQVEGIRSAAADAVPYLLETLKPAKEQVVPRLQQVFENETAAPSHRLRTAMALLNLGETNISSVEFLVSQVPEAKAAECRNIVTALGHSQDASLEVLSEAIATAHDKQAWTAKARLAIVALHLGDTTPASDMLRFEDRPDPIQRTVFIETFPKWHDDLIELATQLHDTTDGALRSGISLGIGSIEDPDDQARQAWQDVFSDWCVNQPDAGTHSAAGWALRTLGLELPEISPAAQPEAGQDWMVTPTGLTMLRIPAGEFVRETESTAEGKEPEPQTVRITRDFFLSDREVSVGLFQQFIEDANYEHPKPVDWQGVREDTSPTADHPVQQVNWYDAVMFCNWLSHREGLTPCYERTGEKKIDGANGYRLPSEAQWEYACRAGTTTAFAFGEDESKLIDYGVYVVNSNTRAAPCGEKFCNAWGLFDMHGNIREWCGDWYASYGEDSIVNDPLGPIERPESGSFRFFRGGCWLYSARFCVSSSRHWPYPASRINILGFRVAQVASASKKPVSGAESGSR